MIFKRSMQVNLEDGETYDATVQFELDAGDVTLKSIAIPEEMFGTSLVSAREIHRIERNCKAFLIGDDDE